MRHEPGDDPTARDTSRDMAPLHSLTALRFFAALYILVYHRRDELSGYAGVLDRILAQGYIGVPLFFVLSGFLLAQPWINGRQPALGRYAVRRFARIAPGH